MEEHLAPAAFTGYRQQLPADSWVMTSFFQSLMLVLIPGQFLYIRHNALLQKKLYFPDSLNKTHSLRSIWLLEENLKSQNTVYLRPQIMANGCETKEGGNTPSFKYFIIFILPYKELSVSLLTKHIPFSTIYDNDIPEKARKVSNFTGSNLLHIYIVWQYAHRNIHISFIIRLNLLTICKTLEKHKIYLHWLKICWCS